MNDSARDRAPRSRNPADELLLNARGDADAGDDDDGDADARDVGAGGGCDGQHGCGGGRVPRPAILLSPRRRLLALRFLPEQVRGPVREVEQSEYERKGDPRYDVDALGPRRELGQPRPAAVFWPRFHVDFALQHFIH